MLSKLTKNSKFKTIQLLTKKENLKLSLKCSIYRTSIQVQKQLSFVQTQGSFRSNKKKRKKNKTKNNMAAAVEMNKSHHQTENKKQENLSNSAVYSECYPEVACMASEL